MFDPYHQWLGIPEGRRPPTHYQLLGIAPTETNAEVIKEAALRQTSHVRIYQTGPHADDCTRLLNEIAQARAVLGSAEARMAYDASLAHPHARPRDEPARHAGSLPRGPLAEKALAAVAYALLLLIGFVISFCVTYQSVHQAAGGAGP